MTDCLEILGGVGWTGCQKKFKRVLEVLVLHLDKMMWNQLNQHSSSSICDDASPKSTYERHTPYGFPYIIGIYRQGRLVWSEHGLFKNVMYFCVSVIFCLFLLGFSLLRFSKQQFNSGGRSTAFPHHFFHRKTQNCWLQHKDVDN